MMQDCGGGKYNTPTAKGLERIWNVIIAFIKKFIAAVPKSYQATTEKPKLRPDSQLLPDPVRGKASQGDAAGPADDRHPREPQPDVEVFIIRLIEEPGVVSPGKPG